MGQPRGWGKVYSFRAVPSVGKARVECLWPGDDEVTRPLHRVAHVDILLREEGRRHHKRELVQQVGITKIQLRDKYLERVLQLVVVSAGHTVPVEHGKQVLGKSAMGNMCKGTSTRAG